MTFQTEFLKAELKNSCGIKEYLHGASLTVHGSTFDQTRNIIFLCNYPDKGILSLRIKEVQKQLLAGTYKDDIFPFSNRSF